MLAIDGRPGAKILAEGVNARGVVEGLAIGGERSAPNSSSDFAWLRSSAHRRESRSDRADQLFRLGRIGRQEARASDALQIRVAKSSSIGAILMSAILSSRPG
jgi:hypothetical protein